MNQQQDITPATTAPPDGIIELQGEKYMRDTGGRLVPIDAIKPEDLLMDETTRKICAFARSPPPRG